MRPRRLQVVSALPVPPDRLRECWVEDWVRLDDEQPRWSLPGSRQEWAELAARTRHRRAVSAWMEEHQVPPELWCQLVPCGRPRFREGAL